MAKMESAAPARKVGVAALGAAVTTILVWLLNDYADAEITQTVAGAITTVVVFSLAYLVPPSGRDQVQS